MDYITSQTPDKGVQIGPEPPISNDSIALTPDKGVQIGKELPIINASIALTPDKGVQIGPEPPISNASIAMVPDKGVQVGPELPISNDSIAMASDTTPGFAGNLIEAGIVLNGTKSAVYKSAAYPANADGKQRPGAVVEYSSEFSVGEGFSVGGTKSELPAGYLRAEFLRKASKNTSSSYVNTGVTMEDDVGFSARAGEYSASLWLVGCGGHFNYADRQYVRIPTLSAAAKVNWAWGSIQEADLTNPQEGVYTTSLNFQNDRKVIFNGVALQNDIPALGGDNYGEHVDVFALTMRQENHPTYGFMGRLYALQISKGRNIVRDFVPCLNGLGTPCLFEKISKNDYKSATSEAFIAGFTSDQARKLGAHLPDGGGKLTISLPTGYEQDAAVANALEIARLKGWTLTIQTYTPETNTEGASTFALKRIWVRKTQDDNGAYIDTNGSRWQVDWCVDILTPDGSTPDAYGYEMFRNIEAATEYWGLTSWVDPEQEEEFSQEL